MDADAGAGDSRVPTVVAGAGSGERSAGTAADVGVATNGDCDGATVRFEALFLTILGARRSGGVGSYIVGGVSGKS